MNGIARTLLVALVAGSALTIGSQPQKAYAYQGACSPFEVGTPYKSGTRIYGWGDGRCDARAPLLEVEVEVWMRNSNSNIWSNWTSGWDNCYNCSYEAHTTSRDCTSGLTRYYYTRVRVEYWWNSPGDYYASGWRYSSTRSIHC